MPEIMPQQLQEIAARLAYQPGDNESPHHRVLQRLRGWREQAQSFLESERYPQWDEVEKHRTMYVDLSKRAVRGDGSTITGTKAEPVQRSLVLPFTAAIGDVRRVQMKAIAHSRAPQFQFAPVTDVSTERSRIGARLIELVIDQALRRGAWGLHEDTFLRDADMLGCGVLYDDWYVREGYTLGEPYLKPESLQAIMEGGDPMQQLLTMLAIQSNPGLLEPQEKWAVVDERPRLVNVDPRKWWRDPHVPMCDWEQGRFCGHRDVMSWRRARQLSIERGGMYFNLKALEEAAPSYQERSFTDDPKTGDSDPLSFGTNEAYPGEKGFMIVDVIHVPLEAASPEWQLGDHDREQIWSFYVANNAVIIRAHPLAARHGRFPYSMAAGDPVSYRLWTPGTGERMDAMQRFASWFYNAIVQEVQLSLNKAGLSHPSLINFEDVLDPNPAGIVRYSDEVADAIKDGRMVNPQLLYGQFEQPANVSDKLEMVHGLKAFAEWLMASNEPVSAMPTDTKRTLGEIQQLFSVASSRIGDVFEIIEAMAYAPLGERLASNVVQFMDTPMMVQILGDDQAMQVFGDTDFLMVERGMVAGAYQYQMSDGKMPPDPLANSEAAITLLTLSMQTGAPINIPVLLNIIARGLGLKNTSELYQPQVAAAMAGGPPEVMPDDQVDAGVAAGNLVPAAQLAGG